MKSEYKENSYYLIFSKEEITELFKTINKMNGSELASLQNEMLKLLRWCNKCNAEMGWGRHEHCPKCDSPPKDHELRNYNLMWHDGDVYCIKCGAYVRDWDAG